MAGFTNNEELVRALEGAGTLSTGRIVEAFRQVDRKDFVPPERREEAYIDAPLPIGAGQTISQPTTVAFMLELLGALPGERVLDLGAGSGWTTALLGRIVEADGEVWGVELEDELVRTGRTNVEAYDTGNAQIVAAGRDLGLPGEAPFHRILVSAAAEVLPAELLDQLRNGGVLVMPIGESVWRFTKRAEGNVESEEFPGYRFVPLRAAS